MRDSIISPKGQNLKIILLSLAVFLICGYTGMISVNAQQTAEPWDASSSEQNAEAEERSDEATASVEMQGSAAGEVIGVNTVLRTLTIREDSYDDNMDTFFVNRDTTFTMVSSLDDIKPGDKVSIDYFVINDKNVADSVLVEEIAHGEETEAATDKVLVD